MFFEDDMRRVATGADRDTDERLTVEPKSHMCFYSTLRTLGYVCKCEYPSQSLPSHTSAESMLPRECRGRLRRTTSSRSLKTARPQLFGHAGAGASEVLRAMPT
jgi:hypothetical protein